MNIVARARKESLEPHSREITDTPPKPRLALAVGAIGHRPNRLPEAALDTVRSQVAAILADFGGSVDMLRRRLWWAFTDEPPLLRLLTGAAEGADRIAAEAAAAAGWRVSAVLPYPAEEYEADFAHVRSREAYRSLLSRAERVLALPGSRADEAAAYEAMGRTILDNADVLLTVWDGGGSAGRGGTTELVARAVALGLPVIHVDAAGQRPPRILWSGLEDYPVPGEDLAETPAAPLQDALPRLLEAVAAPPQDAAERTAMARYLGERERRWNLNLEVPLLVAAMGLRMPRRTDLRPAAAGALARPICEGLAPFLPDARRQMLPLATAFGWADALAIRYAQVFRGAYSSNFLAAAFSVMAGTISLIGGAFETLHWANKPFAVIEVALLAFIAINTWIGRRRDWHRRWREGREVAERLRGGLPLWGLARRPGGPLLGEQAWPAWYARAHVRALGIVPGKLDTTHCRLLRDCILRTIDQQTAYHRHTAAVMRKLETRMEGVGMALFTLALLFGAVGAATATFDIRIGLNWDFAITGLAAALPALGAAMFGIRLIGDFEGVAERSEQMAVQMSEIENALQQDPTTLPRLRARAQMLSETMLGDVQHWRMTTATRKLETPA